MSCVCINYCRHRDIRSLGVVYQWWEQPGKKTTLRLFDARHYLYRSLNHALTLSQNSTIYTNIPPPLVNKTPIHILNFMFAIIHNTETNMINYNVAVEFNSELNSTECSNWLIYVQIDHRHQINSRLKQCEQDIIKVHWQLRDM